MRIRPICCAMACWPFEQLNVITPTPSTLIDRIVIERLQNACAESADHVFLVITGGQTRCHIHSVVIMSVNWFPATRHQTHKTAPTMQDSSVNQLLVNETQSGATVFTVIRPRPWPTACRWLGLALVAHGEVPPPPPIDVLEGRREMVTRS